MKILMVCLGNICRSPLAEGILQDKAKKAGLNWRVDSAGTSSYHEGDPPHVLSQKVACVHSIDISKQTCRRFVKEDMLYFDQVYVMDKEVYADVRRISGELWDPEKTRFIMDEIYPGENAEVPDPWFGGEEGYHLVFEMINEACDAIIKNFKLQKTNNKKQVSNSNRG
jgi:protein-tyrosine phosphatase